MQHINPQSSIHNPQSTIINRQLSINHRHIKVCLEVQSLVFIEKPKCLSGI